MPEAKVFPVALTGAERDRLTRVVSAGTHPARMIMRARVLLALDGNDGSPAERVSVARQIGVTETTVRSVAERFGQTDGNVEATITRKRRATPPVPSVITGEVEARLIALACSAPPAGRARWSLRLLEQRVALIEELPDLDHSTIGRVLKKKMKLRPHLRKCWAIPPRGLAEFAARMEDVLAVYARRYDPARPVVCMDELCEASHNSSNVKSLVM